MNRQSLGNDASDESFGYGREARGSRRLSPHAGQCAAPPPGDWRRAPARTERGELALLPRQAGAQPMAQSRAQASLVASAPEPRAAHARFG